MFFINAEVVSLYDDIWCNRGSHDCDESLCDGADDPEGLCRIREARSLTRCWRSTLGARTRRGANVRAPVSS